MSTVNNSTSDKKTILIAEDSADSRAILALYIRRMGFAVWEASNGLEALKLAAGQPDLIIMDISMPRMDGLEATARLKADPATRNIPVVIATAHIQQARIDSALEAGALDVWLKPFEFRKLCEKLGRYLSRDSEIIPPTVGDAENQETILPKTLEHLVG